MPRLNNLTDRATQRTLYFVVLVWAITLPITGYAYQCGNGNTSCTLSQLASFLDRIKPGFETTDVVYDQIYHEGESTIVFIQRIKHTMNKSQREFVKEHGANKESNLKELCTDEDLKPVLLQGLKLKYVVQDIDRQAINTFVIEHSDCLAN